MRRSAVRTTFCTTMTRFATLPEAKPARAAPAGAAPGPGRSAAAAGRTRGAGHRLLLAVLLAALAGAGARLVWLSGPFQEWRLARAPLPALLRERGRQPDNV